MVTVATSGPAALEAARAVDPDVLIQLITDAGLRVSLTEKLFNELKVEWRHDSSPAPGADRNDLRYLVSVGWQF